MCKLGIRLLLFALILFSFALPPGSAQSPGGRGGRPAQGEAGSEESEESKAYHESALRRFEIITLSSLPFTSIHSYLVTRGVKMFRENQFAPELTPRDYRIIGIGAVSFSLFIGIWDWWHTRHVDISAERIPEPESPPPENEEPPEGAVAGLSGPRPYLVRTPTFGDSRNRGLNRQINEPPVSFVMPLLQIRF